VPKLSNEAVFRIRIRKICMFWASCKFTYKKEQAKRAGTASGSVNHKYGFEKKSELWYFLCNERVTTTVLYLRLFDVLIDYLPVNRFNMLVDICQQLSAFGTWLPFSFPHLEKKSINISNSKFLCAEKTGKIAAIYGIDKK
jgi:hypothetical protein